MADKVLAVNLETQTAPRIRETASKEWVLFGTEDNENLYPQFLVDLYYNSSTHASIINSTAEMIAGQDIECEETDNLAAYTKLKKFMANANGKETMHQIVKKLAFDFKLYGAYALNVIYSLDRTEIVEVHHIPAERIRSAKPNAMGVVDTYFVSANWADTRNNEPQAVPAFNLNDRTSPSQILYTGRYSPEMDAYYAPDYVSGCNWALIDQHIAEFHLNNIQNGFAGSYFISFANGVPSQKERFAIENSLKNKFTGTNAAGRFVLTFSESKDRIPEITPIAMTNADKQYLALGELIQQNLLVCHRVTSPVLCGIRDTGSGLGNNAEELNSAFEVYLNTVIAGYQNNILRTLDKLFAVNDMALPLYFVQAKPITTTFDIEDMRSVMTQAEIREQLGLADLSETEEVAEDEYSKHNLTEHSKLEKFIADFGEKPETQWELIDEEVVDGEHRDYDFEREINELADLDKIELAKAIEAKPNIIAKDRSEKDKAASQGGTENTVIDQDNVSRDYNNYYKVRYVYTTDNFTTNKSGKSRMFCRKMLAADRVYRKRDILNANSLEVNKGFGPKGVDRYNLFLFKGGPECRHFWMRRIYKTSLRNAKKNISDSQLIGVAKARSEGFTVKRNDKLVAIAPQRMANSGYRSAASKKRNA